MIYYTKRIPRTLHRKSILKAIDWAMTSLNLCDDTHIVFEWKDLDISGSIIDEERDEDGRWFRIELRRGICLKETLITIFHELVHAEQMCENRLQYPKGNTVWRGKHVSDLSYKESPWEIEAESKAIEMLSIYNSL